MDKKQFIKQWMKTFEPDTFKAGQNGRYFYRSENLSSGIDLEIFFEELLEDYESALAENTPTTQEQLVVSAVSKSVCTFPIPCNHDWDSEFCKTRCSFRKEKTVC